MWGIALELRAPRGLKHCSEFVFVYIWERYARLSGYHTGF